MGGIHQFASTEFIQSGSIAKFLNGINATGSNSVHGLKVNGSFIADNYDGISTTTVVPPPTLTLIPTVDDIEITSANVGDTVKITAVGDFNSFCFIKNVDDGVVGGLIIEELNEEPENLENNWSPNQFLPLHPSFPGVEYSSLSDNDNTTGFVFNGSPNFPYIFTTTFSSPTIISKYIKKGYGSTSYQLTSWQFEGSNDNFVNDINTLDTITERYDVKYDSGDINNNIPYTSYRFSFSDYSQIATLYELSLFKKPFTNDAPNPSGRWETIQKGGGNGLFINDHLEETFTNSGIYEYLVIANNFTTHQTVVEGITITIN